MPCQVVLKIQEGRPNAADLMKNGDMAMMFITSKGDEPDVRDGKDLRRLALGLKVRLSLQIVWAFGLLAFTKVLKLRCLALGLNMRLELQV